MGAASQAEVDNAQLALDSAKASMTATLDQLTIFRNQRWKSNSQCGFLQGTLFAKA